MCPVAGLYMGQAKFTDMVGLPPLPDLISLLKPLIVECNHEQSRHSPEKTRAYNSVFMMTSFGAKEVVSGDD